MVEKTTGEPTVAYSCKECGQSFEKREWPQYMAHRKAHKREGPPGPLPIAQEPEATTPMLAQIEASLKRLCVEKKWAGLIGQALRVLGASRQQMEPNRISGILGRLGFPPTTITGVVLELWPDAELPAHPGFVEDATQKHTPRNCLRSAQGQAG